MANRGDKEVSERYLRSDNSFRVADISVRWRCGRRYTRGATGSVYSGPSETFRVICFHVAYGY